VSDREEFEQAFPIHEDIAWDYVLNKYRHRNIHISQAADAYNQLYGVWQKARNPLNIQIIELKAQVKSLRGELNLRIRNDNTSLIRKIIR
jgi:hypothetical protein